MTANDDVVRLEDMQSSRLRVIESHLNKMLDRQEKVEERLKAAGQDFYDETALWEVTDNRLYDVHARVHRILEERGELDP